MWNISWIYKEGIKAFLTLSNFVLIQAMNTCHEHSTLKIEDFVKDFFKETNFYEYEKTEMVSDKICNKKITVIL